jgi:hypothetical protein
LINSLYQLAKEARRAFFQLIRTPFVHATVNGITPAPAGHRGILRFLPGRITRWVTRAAVTCCSGAGAGIFFVQLCKAASLS